MNGGEVRKRAIVTGRVQGVGFRYFTERTARPFRVTGLVRNLPDGTVEIEAQGSSDEVESFLEKVRLGPPGSRVFRFDVEPLPAIRGENGFHVGY
jgi:acylphosphatase